MRETGTPLEALSLLAPLHFHFLILVACAVLTAASSFCSPVFAAAVVPPVFGFLAETTLSAALFLKNVFSTETAALAQMRGSALGAAPSPSSTASIASSLRATTVPATAANSAAAPRQQLSPPAAGAAAGPSGCKGSSFCNPLGPTPRLPRRAAAAAVAPSAAAAVAPSAAAARPRSQGSFPGRGAATAPHGSSSRGRTSEPRAAATAASVPPSQFLYRRNDITSSSSRGSTSSSIANAAAAVYPGSGEGAAAAEELLTERGGAERDSREDLADEQNEEGGNDLHTLEEAVQHLIETGAAQRTKRLRLSNIKSSTRPLYIARLPESLSALQQPISIQQDIISLGPGEKLPQHLQEAARRAAPWRLRDSSDLAGGGSTAEVAPVPRCQKLFLSRPNDVHSDCFFLLVEGKEYTEVLPIDGWINFERCAPSKSTHTLPSTADDAEQQSRSKAAREAALAARVAQLRRRSGESDDESSLRSRVRRGKKSAFLAEEKSPSSLLPPDGDELGLRRQRQKRMKQLLRQKAGQGGRVNEYINSALSLTVLRQAEVDWDYEEGERSDDEDDLAAEGKQQQGGGVDAAGDVYGVAAAGDAPSDEEDAAGLGSAADLSNYGQKMKDLLDKAKDEEADDELHQYEGDDDEEEVGERGGAGGTDSGRGGAAAAAARSAASSSVAAPAVAAAAALPKITAAGGSSRPTETIQELESRVIRVMQQHMGRMSVKTFMTAFKVREKNEEFRKIQQIVHKICKMETTEEKQKFIILKPEYRM